MDDSSIHTANKSVRVGRKANLGNVFLQITTEARKRDTKFDILRQRVRKGHTSEGYACFKQWTKSCVK